MKTGVTITKTNYFINREKGTVACSLDYHDKYSGTRGTVTAKAKCAPDDAFDEVHGKRLAESRAKAKLYRKLGKFFKQEVDYIYRKLKIPRLIDISKYCMILADKETDHINKLMK